MSLSRETLVDLMALADGELDGEARERAEKLVEESDEARRVVEAMRAPAIGAWLADAMDARARTGGADGIADAVMARADGAGAGDEGGVVRLSDARARRASRVQLVVASVGAAVALAAGIALYVRSNDSGRERAPVASVGIPSVDTTPPQASVAQDTRPSIGVEVDELDSPHGISVYEIPASGAAARGAHAPSSVVIWIEDEPGAK